MPFKLLKFYFIILQQKINQKIKMNSMIIEEEKEDKKNKKKTKEKKIE